MSYKDCFTSVTIIDWVIQFVDGKLWFLSGIDVLKSSGDRELSNNNVSSANFQIQLTIFSVANFQKFLAVRKREVAILSRTCGLSLYWPVAFIKSGKITTNKLMISCHANEDYKIV